MLQAAAYYLAVAPEEIALTGSTTMGLGLLYATSRSTRARSSPPSMTSSTHDALRLRAQQTGATVRKVRLYDEPAVASEDEIVANLRDAVTPRTRAVARRGCTRAPA